MPIFMVGIAFGLAMDYQVFLVSRSREAYARGQRPRQAVVTGSGHSARVVVAAAPARQGAAPHRHRGPDPGTPPDPRDRHHSRLRARGVRPVRAHPRHHPPVARRDSHRRKPRKEHVMPSTGTMTGKVALVTGAGAAIGLATALAFGRQGATSSSPTSTTSTATRSRPEAACEILHKALPRKRGNRARTSGFRPTSRRPVPARPCDPDWKRLAGLELHRVDTAVLVQYVYRAVVDHEAGGRGTELTCPSGLAGRGAAPRDGEAADRGRARRVGVRPGGTRRPPPRSAGRRVERVNARVPRRTARRRSHTPGQPPPRCRAVSRRNPAAA